MYLIKYYFKPFSLKLTFRCHLTPSSELKGYTSCQPALTSFFFVSQLVSTEMTLHGEELTHSQFCGRCQMTPKHQL